MFGGKKEVKCWWKFFHKWKRDEDADFNTFLREIIKIPVWRCEKCGLIKTVFPASIEGSVVFEAKKK
jgi:hypothetical protein